MIDSAMDEVPKVSIVMSAYNAAQTIAETLNSVLAQTYPYWEQIVVDDGSSDRTGEVVQTFMRQDSRIRMIRQFQGGEAEWKINGRNYQTATPLLFDELPVASMAPAWPIQIEFKGRALHAILNASDGLYSSMNQTLFGR